jgi:hypothetical protein
MNNVSDASRFPLQNSRMPIEIRQGRREDADGSAVYEMVSTAELTAVALLAGYLPPVAR